MHRKYIKKLTIFENLKERLDFVPTKNLQLNFYGEIQNWKELAKYISSNSFDSVHAEVIFIYLSKVETSEFEEFIDTIFEYLNIKEIEVS